MGTVVMRSHDCLKNRLPAEAFRSSASAKYGREVGPRHGTGASTHLTKLYSKSEGFPSCKTPLSQTKPLRSRRANNNRGGCVDLVRCKRRSRMVEHQGQVVVKLPVKKLVMEEVSILKRGQEMKRPQQPATEGLLLADRGGGAAVAAGRDDLALCSTGRLGPHPEILPKHTRLMDQTPHLYAGSGFFTSPPPSCLPLPTSLFTKMDAASTTDAATRALRCLLRLDLP